MTAARIDVGVTAWLTERLPELEPPLAFTRIGDGQSNLTFRVDDAGGTPSCCAGRRSGRSSPRRTTWCASTGS